MSEQQCLLGAKERAEDTHDSSLEEWSDDSSCSSYYSDSESSVPEWESSLDPSGQVLYIECHPFVNQTATAEPETKPSQPFAKNHMRQSTRSKFLKLLRRHDSKRHSKKFHHRNSDIAQEQPNKVTFQDYQEGEIKEIIIPLNQENCFKFGRRTSLVESLLGVTISSFPDGSRVMISGFTSGGDTKNESNMKIGEWLKAINGTEVNVHNVNGVLEQAVAKEEVILTVQRVTGVEVTKDPPTNEIKSQSNFVQQMLNYNADSERVLSSVLIKQPVGVIFINVENLSEAGPEFEGVLYCYPKPYEKNLLCSSRGVFITLSHLLNEVTHSKPQVTSLMCRNRLAHVTYNIYDGGSKLLLIMLPDNRVSQKEIVLLNGEIIRMLEFTYQAVERCFENGEFHRQLDHFFSRVFARILSSDAWVQPQELPAKAMSAVPPRFEDVLPAAHFITLPSDVQMQIDDALTELEASDYRDWNEDPLDCQRLFTILGSALYHSGYLLASHLIHGDLIDVHSFCRQQGLFHLSRSEPLKTLVLWREVFPFSCNRGIENKLSPFKVPHGRRYLLIIGSRKDLLAVIMEAGGCTEPAEENMGPDAFYVEEVQATLAHVQELGVPEIAERWIGTNPGTQVIVPEAPLLKRKPDFLSGFTKSTSPNLNKESSPIMKKQEVTSILKRRSSDQGPLYSLPDDEQAHSEDSASQGGYSERSEVSDEPVLGRRAIRERRNFIDSDEDESDVDDYREGSQMSNGSYDLSDFRQALLNDSEEAQPLRLTNGIENVLFHYVQFDSVEGMLVCPPECSVNSPTLDLLLNCFRSCSQKIHKLFQNTLRFKNMPAQDMSKSVMNKSLIAIKEHGTLFECEHQDDGVKKPFKITYWVVGRLFYMPYPREVYICYQDSVPQNVIDVAFKLGVSLAG